MTLKFYGQSCIYFDFSSCGAATLCGPWLPNSWSFQITQNNALQSVGLLWTSDHLVAESSTWRHTTPTTNIHTPAGIQTHDLNRRAAADLRLRPRGHWDQHLFWLGMQNHRPEIKNFYSNNLSYPFLSSWNIWLLFFISIKNYTLHFVFSDLKLLGQKQEPPL